jgi:hypothetical protein
MQYLVRVSDRCRWKFVVPLILILIDPPPDLSHLFESGPYLSVAKEVTHENLLDTVRISRERSRR